ncbi:CaiB/BaiF CoA transferase family protein [Namhaeicola litoreus]|uniref:CaiB/BaiF CoA transferase family protein n=1 Tax=Namhaeicola litoreus TaxID=1052145 RepID=A0ABW3Y373_9FLAO
MKPLQDILVIDLSQLLSAPSATLRLADLGARVIKVEQPKGDICRHLYVSNVNMNGDSSFFRAINRNKESFQANLKNHEEKERILKLIGKADVLIHNFRPGVVERLGMDHDSIKKINPEIVYGEISGYGKEGPWKNKPGQDLLVQCLSGLTWLNGNDSNEPIPVGLAIADILSGAHLVQGILAALLKKIKTGKGSKVSVSMLESIIDFQFESITTFYNDGGQPTMRPKSNSAHAYLGAPYGVYKTLNGHIALAMGSIPFIGELIKCAELLDYQEPSCWFTERDSIKEIIAKKINTQTTEYWLSILEPADIWCADILDWKSLFNHEGFKVLDMIQKVTMTDGYKYATTRCPIKIDGEYFKSSLGSPILGEHTSKIAREFKI